MAVLHPREEDAAAMEVKRVEELPDEAVTLETEGAAGSTVYMLGSRTGSKESLRGLAAVVGWNATADEAAAPLRHAALIEGSELAQGGLRLSASRAVSLTLRAISPKQFILKLQGATHPATIEAELPWTGTKPKQVSVWRG